jgi:hypothetical protein
MLGTTISGTVVGASGAGDAVANGVEDAAKLGPDEPVPIDPDPVTEPFTQPATNNAVERITTTVRRVASDWLLFYDPSTLRRYAVGRE